MKNETLKFKQIDLEMRGNVVKFHFLSYLNMGQGKSAEGKERVCQKLEIAGCQLGPKTRKIPEYP